MSNLDDHAPNLRNFWVDANTYGGLSVAHHVAFRELSVEEHENVKQMTAETLGRVSKVMSRVSFVNRMRYLLQLDTLDILEGAYRDALEIYLLCTCLDTLAGRDDYYDFQAWLRASNKRKNSRIRGLSDKHSVIRKEEELGNILSISAFIRIINKMIDIYNENYGINSNIKALLKTLPDYVKTEIAANYIIYKQSETEDNWNNKRMDEKIKTIFIDYLFFFRRNKYTHASQTFHHFGGISVMRKALDAGNIELPGPATLELVGENSTLTVTCKYGDEALFVREAILACLASILGVIDPEWIERYRKAELQKRMLYALSFELQYNIKILQAHLNVLSEGILIREQGNSLLISTKVASNILEHRDHFLFSMYIPFLNEYIQMANTFNDKVLETPKNVYGILEEIGLSWRTQQLRSFCESLLNSYPRWTYDPRFIPEF